MKRITIYWIGLALSLAIIFTGSFDTKPEIYLWNWFGYKFGLSFGGSELPVIVAKISALVFVLLMGFDPFKKSNTAS
jgi:hypothetical protein